VSTAPPTIQGAREGRAGGAAGGGPAGGRGDGGAAGVIVRTATPGPAGVMTSDQAEPLHHRTIPGVPSGSGYHPGAPCGFTLPA
jgi:hypothetical protein